MAKIGIGVTTYLRPAMLEKCLRKIKEHTLCGHEYWLQVSDDSAERKGVAFRKNQCLRALQDCDHVFLFDDDCYPIKAGWVEFFTESGHSHLLYMNGLLHQMRHTNKGLDIYYDCGGAFMYLTKEAIQRVGAFNEKFGLFGFEHAEYSNRIEGRKNFYPMLKGTDDYIYCHDYSDSNHKSSISDSEKETLIKENRPKYFNEPIKNIFLPL